MQIKHSTSVKKSLIALGILLQFGHGWAQNATVQQTKLNLKQLESKINQLQQTLKVAHNKQQLLQQELVLTEKKINQGAEELKKLQASLTAKQQQIDGLQLKINTLNQTLHQQQVILSNHLRVRYQASDYQPLKWLLNQDNPQNIQRLFTYYQYLVQARQKVMNEVIAIQKNLRANQQQLQQEMLVQQQLQQQLKNHQKQFDQNKLYHTALMHTLDKDIHSKQQTLENYKQSQANLTRLLTSLVQQSVVQTRRPITKIRNKITTPVQTQQHSEKLHQGVVFFAPEGSPVLAAYPGKVVFCDWLNGYGRLLILDHGWGLMTLYANNQALYKKKGDTVNQGEQIAAVGHSGTLKENGLYFEIRRRGRAIPPMDWMS